MSAFSESELSADIVKLERRILNGKAIRMAEKHDTESKRAYAGIKFMLTAAHEHGLVSGAADPQDEDVIAPYVAKWMHSITDNLERDVMEGHEYNLCPTYMTMMQQARLVAGYTPEAVDLIALADKMDKLLTFQVHMQVHAEGYGDDGGKMNIYWTVASKLHLKLDQERSCYTPEFLDNGKAEVKVDMFQLVTAKGENVQLTSPRSYDAHLRSPKLNLCDREPTLMIPFDRSEFPPETLTVHGYSEPGVLLSSSLLASGGLRFRAMRFSNVAVGL